MLKGLMGHDSLLGYARRVRYRNLYVKCKALYVLYKVNFGSKTFRIDLALDHSKRGCIIISKSIRYGLYNNYTSGIFVVDTNCGDCETVNLQARIDRYRERGFQEREAEILVLFDESAVAVFT